MEKHSKKNTRMFQKKGASALVGLLVAIQVGIFLAVPAVIHATGPPVSATVIESVPQKTETIEDEIANAILSVVLGSLVNMASYFMRTLAYDAATYIASGGQGQGSLIFEKPFDEYLTNVALDSVGEAISSLGKDWGLDLCAPPNLKLQAQLKVGLDTTYQQPGAPGSGPGGGGGRPQSKCSWQALSENWKDGPFSNVDINIDAAADFAGEVNVMETDFGFALGALTELDEFKTAQEEAAKLSRTVNDGFKGITDPISGYINTPGKIVEEEATALTGKHQGELNSEQVAGMYASELWNIIPTSASIFLNTLTSQLLQRLFTEGLVPSEREKGSGGFDFYAVNTVISKRQVAERAFGFLTAATGSKDPGEYDIVAEFATCLPGHAGLNNCVMSEGIKKALDRANLGQPVTLWEAVFEDGLISPDMPLISKRRIADNESEECYKDKLCYSNVQKMRKARILPLGLEIATLLSDSDNPWTLRQVLEGFEDCPDPGPNGIEIDKKDFPFCHLVNPQWILRAPQARCENRVYSPELLLEQSPRRREECVDVSTCISEDEFGNCTTDNYYGFCTNEKNVWHIPGESCEEQFATCRTFTNQETNKVVSYLTRSVEYGSCGPGTVGCRAYVTEQAFGSNEWTGTKDITVADKLVGRQQVLHFNDRIGASGSTCPAEADGCSKFIGALRDPATTGYVESANTSTYGKYIQANNRERFIKQAPAYLGCYDTDPLTPQIEYPTTLQQVENELTDDARCDAYAQVCVEDEVGCELYTPVASGESVPGVVGGNYCPASCVGYNTFKQEKTSFEASVYPLYFIPDTQVAQECSTQHVGCDEFTNISSAETGGEGLEYYTYIKQCEVPDGDNSSVYYTWEGSESLGFVLKVHTLAKVGISDYIDGLLTAGAIEPEMAAQFSPESPVYADDTPVNIIENYALCNEGLYANTIANIAGEEPAAADCRALYDSDGNVYYRLLAETVTVSEVCQPLRKTKSRLIVDESLVALSYTSNPTLSETICNEKAGYWGMTEGYPLPVCQRCAGGGSWVTEDPENPSSPSEGSCVYYGIDAPGESITCTPEANGCRAYTGNNGSNTKPVFEDAFEPTGPEAEALTNAKEFWYPASAVSIAAESLQVNLHSLSVTNNSDGDILGRQLPLDAIETGSSYELRFWARGIGDTISIYLQQNSADGAQVWPITYDPITEQELPISIGTSWREYRVGPVVFTGSATTPVSLVFDRTESESSGVYYIDNMSLYRTDDSTNLIKESWRTAEGYDAPSECFAESQDPRGPFPGAALGCEAYTNSLGQSVYTTGFERLCREKAVGCAPLWDTQNTDATYAEVFYASCVYGEYKSSGWIDDVGTVEVPTECAVTIDGADYGCTIQARERSCSIAEAISLPSDEFFAEPAGFGGVLRIKSDLEDAVVPNETGFFAIVDESSVYIPADTPIESPLFLTDTKESACGTKYLGCELVGIEEQLTPDGTSDTSYEYAEQTVINMPDKYLGPQGTLCSADQVACSAFTSTQGATSFFKDPNANANKLCEYKKPIGAAIVDTEGWYIKNVGHCATDVEALCTSSNECGEGDSCVGFGTVPCYDDYLEDFATYGLWSNGASNYEGFVGECPSGQNLCTELVDPYDIDTSQENPTGKPYYVIFDNRVTGQTGECNGQASLREGCILFDKTDDPNKSYDASATYDASELLADNGEEQTGVTPISSNVPGENDANQLLKVTRDRECVEWLDCQTSAPTIDQKGRQIDICYELGACREYESGECSNFIEHDIDPAKVYLDWTNYINRDTSWFGEELSGYSLYNSFQIGDLTKKSLSNAEEAGLSTSTVSDLNDLKGVNTDAFYLVYEISEDYLAEKNLTSCDNKTDWAICGPENRGRCLAQDCVMPFAGTDLGYGFAPGVGLAGDLSGAALALVEPLCKAPPEETSPFPVISVTTDMNDVRVFATDLVDGAPDASLITDPYKFDTTLFRKEFTTKSSAENTCQFGTCECAYQKIAYDDGTTDYWPLNVYRKNNNPVNLSKWGICRGDFDLDGSFCTSNADCGGALFGGRCEPIDNVSTRLGLVGNCLQFDESRPLQLGGEQEFACLTWYPVDVSLSNVDNFNVSPEAGFLPALEWDAPEGSFSGYYCSDASDAYSVVDTNRFEVKNTIQLQQAAIQVDQDVIQEKGYGDRTRLSCYVAALLDPGVDHADCLLQNAYSFMSAWAYKEIGSNAFVLRAESGTTRPIKFGKYHCGYSGENDGEACTKNREEHQFGEQNMIPEYVGGAFDNKYIPLFSLLPRPYAYDITYPKFIKDWNGEDCGELVGDPCRAKQNNAAKVITYTRSFGTIYYPPRVWDDVVNMEPTDAYNTSQHFFDSLPTTKCSIPNNKYENFQDCRYGTETVEYLQDTTFSNVHAAPGPRYVESNNEELMDRILYRSPFEAVMNEADLDTVHFVPMSYPGGRQKFNPVMFDTNIKINIQYLRETMDTYSQTGEIGSDPILVPYKTSSYDSQHEISDMNVGCRSYDAGNVWSESGSCSGPEEGCIWDGGNSCYYAQISDVTEELEEVGGFSGTYNNDFQDLCREEGVIGYVQNGLGGDSKYSIVCKEEEDTALVLTYVLEKDLNDMNSDGISRMKLPPWAEDDISYAGKSEEDISIIKSDERNQVNRRYVMIFSDNQYYAGYGSQTNEPHLPWIRTADNALKIPDVDVFFEKDWDGSEGFCYRNKNTNWFAIGMDFNKNGEFLGYLSRYCNDYQGTFDEKKGPNDRTTIWENGINLAVVATVNNMCTEFAEVYSENGGTTYGTNKAWTNRVWRDSTINPSGVVIKEKNAASEPYGALPSLTGKVYIGSNFVADSTDAPEIDLRQYNFYNLDTPRYTPDQGIPFSCQTPFMEGFHYDHTTFAGYEMQIEILQENYGGDVDISGVKPPWVPRRCHFYYPNINDANPDFEGIDLNDFEDVGDGKTRLNQLFSKFYDYIIRKKKDWKGEITYNGWRDVDLMQEMEAEKDVADDVAVPSPPQIYSLNPATCFPEEEEDAGGCTAGEAHNFTINGRNGVRANYDRDPNGVVDEDQFGFGEEYNEVDYIISPNGSYLAQASFFAFADDNRMPIRRVLIDWGDDEPITNEGVWGNYKNKKPFCEPTNAGGTPSVGLCRKNGETAPTGLTCLSSDDECPLDYECLDADELLELDHTNIPEDFDRYDQVRFGNLPRACEDGNQTNKNAYFQYKHIYGCDKKNQQEIGLIPDEILSPYHKERLSKLGWEDDDKVCIYRPRIQVMDNWGWCNGSEVGSGEGGVYLQPHKNDDATFFITPNENGYYSERLKTDAEGNPETDAEGNQLPLVNECKVSDDAPWTYYRGLIIVVPQ